MPRESKEVGQTVRKWERGIRELIKSEARRLVVVKRVKVGKIKLKGW